MAAYEYKALDSSGKLLSGIIDADNAKVARSQLRKQGLFPTEVQEQTSGRSTTGEGLNIQIELNKLKYVSLALTKYLADSE